MDTVAAMSGTLVSEALSFIWKIVEFLGDGKLEPMGSFDALSRSIASHSQLDQ